MAKQPKKKPVEQEEPVIEIEEPKVEDAPKPPKDNSIWMRGFHMILFALFFGIAETVLGVLAIVQFFWMLFKEEKNESIAGFGESLGKWFLDVVRFQTGETEDKPFPWKKWE